MAVVGFGQPALAEVVAPVEQGWSVAPNGLADDLARACSFSADTEVLMADGTTKPISQIVIGDSVLAADPETGERGARQVTALWVHPDTLVDLEIDGVDVTTTEDHPFWNATDSQWQRADALDTGDLVLAADGDLLQVDGIDWTSTTTGTAYNLTVNDLNTYYVAIGDEEVLVHNQCGVYRPSAKHHPNARTGVSPAPANGQAALDLSVQVKPTSPRRVAYEPSSGEFVVLDQTSAACFTDTRGLGTISLPTCRIRSSAGVWSIGEGGQCDDVSRAALAQTC